MEETLESPPSPGSRLVFTEPLPLTVYVHVPWCVRKCPYCDFNSHALPSELPEAAYVDRLLKDLEQELPFVWGRRPNSVFIGGGTPSLFSAESIDRLLGGLRARLAIRPDAEITLEANPGAVETGRFREYRAAGINRLSIGVQSFDDGALAAIGRVHNGAEARRAAEAAHAADFTDFNLDLMYGLPGQTVAAARRDVRDAIDLAPSHVSHYQLTLEPNTPFFWQPPALPGEQVIADMETACRERLQAAGYCRYEVSAFAIGGLECVHNRNYWEFGDYLGSGAGAHGKLTDAARGRVVRRSKRRHPADYLKTADSLHQERELTKSEVVLEFMMNALRLVDGFPPALFQARTGLGLEAMESAIGEAQRRGLVECSPSRICASPLGFRFLNDLVGLFLHEDSKCPNRESRDS